MKQKIRKKDIKIIKDSMLEMRMACQIKEIEMDRKFNKIEARRIKDNKRAFRLKIALIVVVVVMSLIKGLTVDSIQDLILKIL